MLVSRVVKNTKERIPLEEQTAAYKMFNWRYPVMISGIHLMTPEYASKAALITSGNAKADTDQLRAPVEVQLTIADLAEFLGDGVSFRLVRPEDSKAIYQIIMEHLRNWMTAMTMDPNRQNTAEKDLILLDRLAGEIYKYARHYMSSDPVQGSAQRHFADIARRRGIGRVRLSEEEKERAKQAAAAPMARPEEHSSLAQAIMAESRLRR